MEEYISWEPNTVIYKFGDQSDYAYLLEKGAVEILSENGTKVGYVNAKEVFGEQSILLETPRTFLETLGNFLGFPKQILQFPETKQKWR